jgi:hypothetical protein
MKNSIDTIGNRTRDLPACSAVASTNCATAAPHNTITFTEIRLAAYVTRIRKEIPATFYSRNLRERGHSDNPDVDGTYNITVVFKNTV